MGRRRGDRAGRRGRRAHRQRADDAAAPAGRRRGRHPGDRGRWLLRRPRPGRRAGLRRGRHRDGHPLPADLRQRGARGRQAALPRSRASTTPSSPTRSTGCRTGCCGPSWSRSSRSRAARRGWRRRSGTPLAFQELSGTPWKDSPRGPGDAQGAELSLSQMVMAANTPMLLKAAMVDGGRASACMASGQVVGVHRGPADVPGADRARRHPGSGVPAAEPRPARRAGGRSLMDLTLSPEQTTFRDEARAWLAANVPTTPLPSMDTAEGFVAHQEWEAKLRASRWSVVAWPEQFGGRDASLVDWGALRGGVLPRRRSRSRLPERHLPARADHLRPRHPRAAGAVPALDGQRRDSGHRPGRARRPVPTSPRCARPPYATRPVAAGCCPGRRPGPRERHTRTGDSACSGPIPQPSGTAA